MPKRNRFSSAVKVFKKPKFDLVQPEVITLSDSEESDDNLNVVQKSESVINISESSSDEDEGNDDPSIEIVTIDDDVPCTKQSHILCVHGETPDFIPIPVSLSNKTRNKAKCKKRKKKQPEEVPKKNFKFTPILKLVHSNIYNENEKVSLGLRPVVIDGSNVAFGYGNGEFKYEGVIVVIKYFLNRGHTEIVCLLPAHYRNRCQTPTENSILTAYEKDGIIIYTPSRRLNGKAITPYDDRFIVQYASVSGGVIISNDGYRDLWNEETSWRETIEKRIINYTFIKGILMLPKDPLGRNGPSLDEMLKFP